MGVITQIIDFLSGEHLPKHLKSSCLSCCQSAEKYNNSPMRLELSRGRKMVFLCCTAFIKSCGCFSYMAHRRCSIIFVG